MSSAPGEVSDRIAALTPKQRAYLAIKEMQSQLEESERRRNEPIAVVGMACRFPGDSNSPEEFWDFLKADSDGIVAVPKDRYNVDDFFEEDMSSTLTMNTRWGGYVKDVDKFDAGFFGISKREAAAIDPQQRMMLETAWEAMENAGIAVDRLAGSATGVYLGLCSWDYSTLLEGPHPRGGTGIALSIAANRISYTFDFHGPSMVVDTACSSSLLGVDLACQALRAGEIDAALAGGANVLMGPYWTVSLSQAGFLAPDGKCKTFDAEANGYVRGEGCGMVMLKRLSDALRDGDDIKGVILSSAINQDGRSNGLTAPNGLAQQAVYTAALRKARLEPRDVQYIESHGTGTSLGDVVEVESLWAVYGRGRDQDCALTIASLKTKIGHLEPASGIASLIKVMLALRHEEIPAHRNLKKINPDLVQDPLLRIPLTAAPWKRGTTPRVAGISSFGFGGTNAHLIVGEAPAQESRKSALSERPVHVLTLSAKTPKALIQLALRYSSWLASHPEVSIADVCHTANVGRSSFEHRLAVRAESRERLEARLAEFAAESKAEGAVQGVVRGGGERKAAFVFETGSDAERTFAARWRSWGIEPAAVAGSGAREWAIAEAPSVPVFRDASDLTANGFETQVQLSGGEAAWAEIADQLTALFVQGFTIDWRAFDEGYVRRRIPLPTYPFLRTRCWYEESEMRRFPGPFSNIEARRQ
jgi:acyl transferase domain-containing protein